ncbi:MAG TPA: hypothetical protein VFQ35_09755 [Polyangiaceae bacterium]|nr:hypothetical protein [Polyangiaceae bacterium]
MKELGTEAQALVRAGRVAQRPTMADRERNFEALRARIGDAAFAETASHVALHAGRSLPMTAALTAVGVVVVAGGLFFGLRGRVSSGDTKAAVSVRLPPVVEVVNAPPDSAHQLAQSSEPAPAKVAAPQASTASNKRASTLALEVAILSRAASSLRAGRPTDALKAVDEHQAKFPNGLLTEERRAARAQALCALGRRGEADADLARLSSSSPQAVRARNACANSR